jgi:pSer/pThr/pTyr-binding forkhead associated (FHA) protein
MSPAIALLIVRALLALGLYVFLAVLLVHLWRDLRRAGSSPSVPVAHLTLLGSAQGERAAFVLNGVNLVGRARDNTIALDDVTVSAYHARLSHLAGQWVLEDLGSRNGTRVNGVGVEGMLVVTYGDELQFGEVLLGLRAGPAGTAPPDERPAGAA